MKKIILSVFASAVIFFNSCDKIDGPYSEPVTIDTSSGTAVRKVLIEEYTGHTCIGCPSAHAEGERLQSLNGNRVIIMAIHSGPFAKPSPHVDHSYEYDFRTQEGN